MTKDALQSKPLAYNRTKYRPENAYWMANLAQLSYTRVAKESRPDATGIWKKLQKLDSGFKEVAPFDRNSSQAILVRHEHYVTAAFRGTDEQTDWWDNINALPEPGPFGAVHRGFQSAMMDVWPAMRARLREFRKDHGPSPLWLTGHSLGGAMATLAAAQLIHADEPFNGVYTFGQPRCGDREFARIFNEEIKGRLFRFQNNNDIVTRVPARLMNYSHVGKFVYITSDGKLDSDIGWWHGFLDTVRGAADDIGDRGIDAIEDHGIDEYLNAIREWGDRPPAD